MGAPKEVVPLSAATWRPWLGSRLAGSLFLCALAQGTAAHTGLTLEVGSWVPYIDFSAPNRGVLASSVQHAFQRAGVPTALRETSWKAAEDRIDRAGIVSFGWIRTSEREARWHFSRPVCATRTVLVTRANQPIVWSRLEQLKDIRLGWSRGYSYGNALDQLRPSLDITEMSDDTVALKRLLMGSVDAVPMDPLVARQLIRQAFSAEEGRRFAIDLSPQHTIEKTELHVVCAQSSATCSATLEQFNKGLRQVRGDGPVPACGDAENTR